MQGSWIGTLIATSPALRTLVVVAAACKTKDYYTYRTSKRCSVHLCSLAGLIRPSKHACDLAPRFPRHAVQRRFIGPPPEAARAAVVRTAAGSVARCEEKITAALEPTSLRVAHRVDKTSVGRMERNGYRRSPTRRTTQMARTSPSFAYSARALSTASTHTEWLHTGLCAFRGTFARQTPTACHAEHPRRA